MRLGHLAELEASGELLVARREERDGEKLGEGVVDEGGSGERDDPSCT